MLGSWNAGDLPNLTANNHSITSSYSRRYNCIAWAAGNDTQWWWPVGRYYWPPNIPREETIDAFVRAYGTVGYCKCDDGSLEPDFEKIALYATQGTVGGLTPTHAARLLPSGRWTSKLGVCEDIEHENVDSVACPTYGTAVIYLKRPRQVGDHVCT